MTGADNAAGWDRLADAYQEHVGWPDDDLCWGLRCPPESELRILGELTGRDVVVVGCGGGQDLVALARLGPRSLHGLDPSARQLDHARRRLAAAGVTAELTRAGAEDLSALPDACADAVVSVQALNYVEELAPVFAQVHRILRPGGVLALSVMHPADVTMADEPPHALVGSWFDARRDWVWDDLAETDVAFTSWYPTPSQLFTAVTGAGLVVERLLEPAPSDDPVFREMGWLDDAGWAKLDRVPSSIVLAARRR